MMNKIFGILLIGLPIFSTSVAAQTVPAVTLQPAVWVDPDGCQHWVLDLGIEGMMSPILDRNGRPACNVRDVCMAFSGDMLFATNKANLTAEATAILSDYFQTEVRSGQAVFTIVGHSDSVGSDAYNIALSQDRAEAVAAIAIAYGASAAIGAQGESSPVASNDTEAGRNSNRRVEIICE